jgi:DNA modification methylase
METIKVVKITDIKGNPNNPRIIKDDKFKKLVESIKAFPEMVNVRPIVVNTDMIVLGGNMRLKAMKEAGWKEAPIQIVNWDEQKQKEFIVKDNVGYGEWDWDDLANNWDAEELVEWGLDIPNFDATVLEAEEDNFAAPEGGIETDIVLGDLFEIGEHRLLCGDSTDSDQVAKLMNGQKADMVFTDPPYGMHLDTDYTKMPESPNGAKPLKHEKIKGDSNDFSEELINTIFSHFNNTKDIFIWGADYFAELLPNKNEGSWIVWDKRVEERFDKMIGSAFELCWSKSKHKREIARFNNTLFSGEADARNKIHPTQKPIKLAEWFFNKWGNQNDLIVDLYLGSGTTMVASQQLNRKCYGMEFEPKYCQGIVDRMKKLDPTLIIKKNGITI